MQTVEFGKNLLDVKITKDHGSRATAFIPLGAKIMSTDSDGNEVETNERVDITSVNDGRNYIYIKRLSMKSVGYGRLKYGRT